LRAGLSVLSELLQHQIITFFYSDILISLAKNSV